MTAIYCTKEQAIDILKGTIFLTVDDDGYTLTGNEWIESLHKESRPLFDYWDWCNKEMLRWGKQADILRNCLLQAKMDMRDNDTLTVRINKRDFIKAYSEFDYSFIYHEAELSHLVWLIKAYRNCTDYYIKLKRTVDWINKYIVKNNEQMDLIEMMIFVKTAYDDLLFNTDTPAELDMLDNFMQSKLLDYRQTELEIKKISSEGIKPVNILDNYDAGWLSPTGEYYALNGDISNMLHISIADLLVEEGIIPKQEDNNPSSWLEFNGWVKIHHSNINYAAWDLMTYFKDKENIAMTDIQKDLIYQYGEKCCNGILELGYCKEVMTTARFNMTELHMLRKYFLL